MSKSLSAPWLLSYLTQVAESAGGNLLSIDPHPQSKKVQLVKFLTHQIPDQDNWIWVVISDSQHTIPARLGKAAMDAYRRHPIYGGKPISSLKTALVQIKLFKPSFARIPRGPGNEGLTQNEHLFLDINEFDLKGSFGELTWGRPRDVEAVEDMKLWADGLRAGGGGGNVLKLRREQREQASTSKVTLEDTHQEKQPSPHFKTQVLQQTNSLHLTREASHKSSRSASPTNCVKSKKLSPRREYMRRWQLVLDDETYVSSLVEGYQQLVALPEPGGLTSSEANTLAANAPSTPPRKPKRKRGALDMSSSPSESHRSHSPETSRGPQTPSAWSPSEYGGTKRYHMESEHGSPAQRHSSQEQDLSSPVSHHQTATRRHSSVDYSPEVPLAPLDGISDQDEAVVEEADLDTRDDILPPSSPPHPTSSFRPPTPAQRQKPKPTSSFSTALLQSTAPPLGSPLQLPESTSQPADMSGSLPTPTSSPPSPPKRSQRMSQRGDEISQNHRRRVSDAGRILVPNSDTSGTAASQPQPSQSQRLPGLPSSQPQGDKPFLDSLSQLPLYSQVQNDSQEDSQARSGQSLSYTDGSQPQEKGDLQNQNQLDLAQSQAPPAVEISAGPAVPVDNHSNALSPSPKDLMPSIDAIRTNEEDDEADATESEDEEDQLISPNDSMAVDIEALKQEEEEESQEATRKEPPGEFDTDDERVDDDIREALSDEGTKDLDYAPHFVEELADSRSTPTPPCTPANKAPESLEPPSSSRRSVLQNVAAFASSLFSGRLSGGGPPAVVPQPESPEQRTVPPKSETNPYHDAEAWRQPAFARRRAESSRRGSSVSERHVSIEIPVTADVKSVDPRTSSVSSDEPKPPAPRGVKRRRVVRSRSSVDSHRPAKRTRRSSIPVVVSSSPEPSPPPSPKVSPTVDIAENVKDDAGPSAAKQESSIPPAAVRHIDFRQSLPLSAKRKGKQPMRPSTSFKQEPSPLSHSTPRMNTSHVQTDLVPKTESDEEPERPVSQSKPKPKLGGYKLDLTMRPADVDGLGVTWPQLDEHLLAVGRARFKEKKRRGG